jgi:hypothetical protein
MKKKKINVKLSLKKQTISKLNMSNIKGGLIATGCCLPVTKDKICGP